MDDGFNCQNHLIATLDSVKGNTRHMVKLKTS